jgi:hypothetical protein
MRKQYCLLAISAALLTPGAPAQASTLIGENFSRTSNGETVQATFTNPVGATTTRRYSGLIEIIVSGRGYITFPQAQADAFYGLYGSNSSPQSGGNYYTLSLGSPSDPLLAVRPDQTVLRGITFINNIGPVPAGTRPDYEPLSRYNFVVDLGLLNIQDEQLQFGVTEGFYGDNDGYYDVSVYQLGNVVPGVPEPGTWAVMIIGFGVIGSALRRRKALRLRPAG